jgi:hypothetical protein
MIAMRSTRQFSACAAREAVDFPHAVDRPANQRVREVAQRIGAAAASASCAGQ